MSAIKKAKELYDAYKLIVWLIPIVVAGWDYFNRFFDVPDRLEADEVRFIETRKKDSIMFVKYRQYQDSINRVMQEQIRQAKQKIEVKPSKPTSTSSGPSVGRVGTLRTKPNKPQTQ